MLTYADGMLADVQLVTGRKIFSPIPLDERDSGLSMRNKSTYDRY
jgi:hypothetical protein